MRLYLEEHGGELGGRPARLVVADDGGTAEQGRRAARELIERDRVDVITGLLASPVAEAVVAEAGRTPVVVANAGGPTTWAGPACSGCRSPTTPTGTPRAATPPRPTAAAPPC
ncbi:ABC transporter substrate-binding protein [Nonomuraea ferruginea]